MDEKLLREMDEQWGLVRELAATEKRSAADVVRLLRRVIEDESFSTMFDASQGETKPVVTTKVADALLEPVGTIDVPATTKPFKSLKRFVVDVSVKTPVKISYVGDNFKSWFGKMLVAVHSGSNLASHVLTRDAYDREILSALGGEAKCETTLAEIWQLMSLQGHGQPGALLADGKANIFYVRDQAAVLRAVLVLWFAYGWLVLAFELGFSHWSIDRRVFVRNS